MFLFKRLLLAFSVIFLNKILTQKKRGATTIESGPKYIYILQSCFFLRKLHVIFCIVFIFMLHNLHRTYTPH